MIKRLSIFPILFVGFAAAEPSAVMPEKHFEVLDKYCLSCHDSDTEKGEVNLDVLEFNIASDIRTAEIWNKVLNALNSGEMPPEDKKQLTAEEKTTFLDDLSTNIVTARKILTDSGGEITLRRLNRREYANTLEDLLGVRPDTSNLPDDQASSEYDTQGASLFFSSDQLEQYLSTAKATLELALSPPKQRESQLIHIEPEDHYVPFYANLAVESLDRAKNYYGWLGAGANDEVAKEFGFLDSWQANRSKDVFDGRFAPLHKWLQAPENRKGAAMMITIKNGFTQMKLPQLRAWQPGKYIIRVRAGAYKEDPERFRYLEFVRREDQNVTRLGWRKVNATLQKPETIEFEIDHEPGLDAAYWVQKRSHMDRGDKSLHSQLIKQNGYGTPWGVWVDWFEMEGPLPAEPNQAIANLIFEKPDEQSQDDYVKEVFRRFAVNAFRGEEPSQEFLDNVFARYTDNVEKGQKFKEALVGPLSIILSTPSFLYMIEATGDESSEELTQHELAVRLAYFLTSSPPDEELLSLASEGKLKKEWQLEKQVNRLLKDPRSERFVRSFVYQWLEMDRLGMFAFDGRDFPTFDNAIRDSAGEEVYQSVMTIMKEGLPLQNLLKADYVVVNDLLAGYYGLEGVDGDHWRKVQLPEGSPRGGLLGSAAVMAMGSDGQRSSPVERGAWVLRHLLNTPPPPAPPNVPMLSRFDGELLASRELQRAHQEEPQCAQCHRKIDPIGYGLENFDAAGAWREEERVAKDAKARRNANYTSFAVDPSGELADGTQFANYFELRDLVAKRNDGFASGLAEALISYGLGRPYGFTDHDLAQEILTKAKEEDYTINAFIHALVQSKTFQTK